jgi:hypothetical protein
LLEQLQVALVHYQSLSGPEYSPTNFLYLFLRRLYFDESIILFKQHLVLGGRGMECN